MNLDYHNEAIFMPIEQAPGSKGLRRRYLSGTTRN
jgi:hypothetical protein